MLESLEQIDAHLGGVLLLMGNHQRALGTKLLKARAELTAARLEFAKQVQTVCTGGSS